MCIVKDPKRKIIWHQVTGINPFSMLVITSMKNSKKLFREFTYVYLNSTALMFSSYASNCIVVTDFIHKDHTTLPYNAFAAIEEHKVSRYLFRPTP